MLIFSLNYLTLLNSREVSEDHAYDTIEFNEFLQMMGKQINKKLTPEDLIEAFRLLQLDFLIIDFKSFIDQDSRQTKQREDSNKRCCQTFD